MFLSQVIQTFSAKDQDLPQNGHKFSFKPSETDINNKNFTIRDFGSELSWPGFWHYASEEEKVVLIVKKYDDSI